MHNLYKLTFFLDVKSEQILKISDEILRLFSSQIIELKMVIVYSQDIKKFTIKVVNGSGKESFVEFAKVKQEDKSFWQGKTIKGEHLDHNFPAHYTFSEIISLFNKTMGYSTLKSVSGWDIGKARIV